MVSLRLLLASAALGLMSLVAPAQAELRLVMFEQDGCQYCIKWDREIGPIYPKTTEGRAAPLQKVHLRDDWKQDITLTNGRPLFTPTFVLVRDGVELTRLEGYPGEDFFWGLVAKMLKDQPEWATQMSAQADATNG